MQNIKITLVTSFSKGVCEGQIRLAYYVSELSSGYKGRVFISTAQDMDRKNTAGALVIGRLAIFRDSIFKSLYGIGHG